MQPSSNSGTAGYLSGGGTAGVGVNVTSITKINYSNDSVTTLSASLSAVRDNGSGGSNRGTAGYVVDGYGGSDPSTVRNNVEKIAYSNDTKSTLSATFTNGYTSTAGVSNSGSF